jgi:U3 small nucleolar RNA-associated protein 15
MAIEVVPLQQLRLPQGPSPLTAEQRYWRSFRDAKHHTSTAAWPISHISFPAPSTLTPTIAAATRLNDLFAVSSGPRVQLFSIRKRDPVKLIGRFDAAARGADIRPDGKVLVAGDDSGKMQVFDVGGSARAAILKTWHSHKEPVWVAKWSPYDLTTLMSTSDDKTVQLWDLTSNDPARTFQGHMDYVRSGAFMPGSGGKLLVSGSYDTTVRVWDTRSPGAAVLTFKHESPVEAVLPLSSGTTVLAAAGNTISVLDLAAAKPLQLMSNHAKTVTSLCLASNNTRVVSGSLDGQIKVFDPSSWKVVSSAKYPSPILAVSVVPAGPSADDRHLAVGMQSGVLSIKTRLTGAAAQRDRERAAQLAARDAGNIEQYEAKQANRKRKADADARLDLQAESADVIIANEAWRGKKEQPWQKDLRHGNFAKALDFVVDRKAKGYAPMRTLTLLLDLRHRGALRLALEGRNEATVLPILKWVQDHVFDPRYTAACVEAGIELMDLYAEFAEGSEDLATGFRLFRIHVIQEVERKQLALQTKGMVEGLMMSTL